MRGKAPPQRLEQAEVDAAPRSNPPEIQQQQRRDAGGDGLLRQAQRIRAGAARVVHGGMQDRRSPASDRG